MSKQEQGDGSLIEVVKPKIAAFIDTPLRDPRLSWKAKGIAAYLLSKPPGWQIWTGDLVRRSTDGKAAVFAGLKELETLGYLKRERVNGKNGRIEWRKTLSATPDMMWTDADDVLLTETASTPTALPLPEKPVMASPCTDLPYTENRDMVPPCTDFPCMEKPCMENRTHSITHSSISNSNEERGRGVTAQPSEEEGAASPSEKGEEVPPAPTPVTAPTAEPEPVTATAPVEHEPDGLAIVRRICEDCSIKIAPETVYGYAPVSLIVAEAARWWDETPAHQRAKNAGLLVYRIKTREYAALTQEEIIQCPPYGHWMRGDADEPSQPELPIQERAVTAMPRRPRDAWSQFVEEFIALQGADSMIARWILECAATWDGDRVTIVPRTSQYLDFVQTRLSTRIQTAMNSFAGYPVTVSFVEPSSMQNAA